MGLWQQEEEIVGRRPTLLDLILLNGLHSRALDRGMAAVGD